jgi:hypothetical protein
MAVDKWYLDIQSLYCIEDPITPRSQIFWCAFIIVFGLLEHDAFFDSISRPHPLELLLVQPVAHHVCLQVT